MGIYYILLRRISSGANNCVQRVFDKNVFYNDISPPFKMFIINTRWTQLLAPLEILLSKI